MNFNELRLGENTDLEGIDDEYFLVGLLSVFQSHFQAMADNVIGEITWKQFFLIICLNLCKENPTVNNLADILGTSHQNVKRLLQKLEDKGFVCLEKDAKDARKLRVVLTDNSVRICEENDKKSKKIMGKIYNGISKEDILTTIRTISKMKDNIYEHN